MCFVKEELQIKKYVTDRPIGFVRTGTIKMIDLNQSEAKSFYDINKTFNLKLRRSALSN